MHKYSIFLFFSLLFCNIILAQTSEEVKVINLLLYNGIRTRDNHNVFLLSKKKASLFENELQLNEFQRYLRADSIDIDIRLFEALRVDTATEYWYHVLGDNKDKRQSEALILDTTTTIFWDRTNYIISQNAIGQNLIYSSKKKTKIIKKGYGKNINKIMNSKPYSYSKCHGLTFLEIIHTVLFFYHGRLI